MLRYGGIALLAFAIAACTEGASYDPKDPWSDPFFREGFHSSELDHVMNENAPSVGWLSNPDHKSAHPPKGVDPDQMDHDEKAPPAGHEDELLGAEPAGAHSSDDAQADDGDEDGDTGHPRSFSEKAQEATLATLSILVGAGMAALPYLVGT
jgi:hypothetical protein